MRGETNQIKFLYQGITIDDRTRDYIEKRLGQIEKMLDKIMQTDIEISMDKKGKFRVEVMIKTDKDMFRAIEVSESIEGSTDILVDELKTQIRRKKEKISTKILRGARSIRKKMSLDKDARF
ncbi:MAG: ribosome-associated translation inhibitor RaiA [Candidatus Moranbacteria bacterium]|nr:ribosome-associated translation inhibitor RaiA [Candidatus Moranbacteria bacterium]